MGDDEWMNERMNDSSFVARPNSAKSLRLGRMFLGSGTFVIVSILRLRPPFGPPKNSRNPRHTCVCELIPVRKCEVVGRNGSQSSTTIHAIELWYMIGVVDGIYGTNTMVPGC
eukprot:scaffold1485_cov171-Amphora_coffeaeformis.AAC.27